jgi:hypothetical protein
MYSDRKSMENRKDTAIMGGRIDVTHFKER